MTIRRQLDIAQLHVAARALGRTAGSGARGWTLWRFGAGTLEIEHAGVAYTLDAPGDGVGNGRTGEPSITSVVGTLGLPVLTLSLGTIMIGLLSALAFRLPLRQAVTIGIEVGMQNAALGIGLAITALGSEEIAMPAVVYGIVAYFTCAVALLIGRRFVPHRAAPAPA